METNERLMAFSWLIAAGALLFAAAAVIYAAVLELGLSLR
jgi:hypothetical protein